jgi:alkanesulfonate monooxygenase SsuD/methylene tetrahydromethanopterin reductase-like flavin-dependent oxidoreductase (luciferase family)
MGDVGIMGMHVPGMSWREIRESAVLAEELGYRCLTMGESYIGGMGVFYHEYMQRIGFGAEADRVRHAFQSRDRDGAARLVTDEMVDAVTIIGNARRCRDRMERYFEAGVQEIRLVFNEPDKAAYLRALRAVAPRG